MSDLPVKQGTTLVAVLMDRSGSMAGSLIGMETGVNTFIQRQAQQPADGVVMLAQFDEVYEIVWNLRPLKGAPRYALRPRGGTALYDAIGMFITDVCEVLADETVHRKVIMAIVTDGAENRSSEWDLASVKEWIAHQREHYGWEFVFLGANLDAVATAGKFGIPEQDALTFSTRRATETFKLLDEHVSAKRAGTDQGFTETERRRAIGS